MLLPSTRASLNIKETRQQLQVDSGGGHVIAKQSFFDILCMISAVGQAYLHVVPVNKYIQACFHFRH